MKMDYKGLSIHNLLQYSQMGILSHYLETEHALYTQKVFSPTEHKFQPISHAQHHHVPIRLLFLLTHHHTHHQTIPKHLDIANNHSAT